MPNKPITITPPPSLVGKPSVNLEKSDFEALIEQKGYDVYHDRALKCPCKPRSGGDAQSTCKNCGGSGWIYINRHETRMVIQSMNIDTKYKEWTEERLGSARITARDIDQLAFMDRITLINAEAVFSQVLHPKKEPGNAYFYATTRYNIKTIKYIFLFKGVGLVLQRLNETTDYTLVKNQIRLNASFSSEVNPTITVRYIHEPEFTVLDLSRDLMYSTIKDKCTTTGKKEIAFPISAVARRSHYMPDRGDFEDDDLLDNSFTEV